MRLNVVTRGIRGIPLVVALTLAASFLAIPTTSENQSSTTDLLAPGPYRGPSTDQLPVESFPWAANVFDQCGDLALVFRNPDLRPHADGRVHAEGQFFIQFQVVGAGAAEVTKLSFSFGASNEAISNPDSPHTCSESIPDNAFGKGTAGAYLYYYRSDFTPEDGFVVPILTKNVPDGEYGAAIHAYIGTCNEPAQTAGCIEVARAWTLAVVDNCPHPVSATTAANCPFAADQVIGMDHTKPWPLVLPGDGDQADGAPGLTIEFAEEVIGEQVSVAVNGEPVTVEAWNNPWRDSDLTPNNDNQQCPGGEAGTAYVCSRQDYGPGFQWAGTIEDGDSIQIRAVDQNGNEAVKTVHVGAPSFLSRVELTTPEINIEALNGDSVAIKPGEFHEFNLRLTNVGADEAHANLIIEAEQSAGFRAKWADAQGTATNHVVVPVGSEEYLKVIIDTDESTPEMLHTIAAIAEYDVEGQLLQKDIDLFVTVSKTASGAHQGQHGQGIDPGLTEGEGEALDADNETEEDEDDEGFLPAPGLAAAALAIGGAAWMVGARRKD